MLVEIDQFMDYLKYERNASDKTVDAYNSDLIQFYRFLLGDFTDDGDDRYITDIIVKDDDVDTGSIKKEHIKSYLGYIFDCGLKKSSIERKIASIKTFFKFLYNRGFLEKNPADRIVYPKKSKRLPRFLYFKEVEMILDFEPESFIDFRDKAILETFYSTGVRVGELASADLVKLDIDSGRLKVFGKGSQERFVFLNDDTCRALRLYLNKRKHSGKDVSGPLFVNNRGGRITERGIYDIIKKRVRAAGLLEKVSPHTFRHSFATEMLNQGADLRAVQEMLGHRSLSSTQIYTHTTKARLKNVYENAHPHSKKNKDD